MGDDGTKRLWVCDACDEEWASVEPTDCGTCGAKGAPVPSAICSACGEAIRQAARVCRHCGTGVATKPCPSCAAVVSADSTSCTVCGWMFQMENEKKEAPPWMRLSFNRDTDDAALRPFRVILLGVLYLLLGVSLCLPMVFGGLEDMDEYGLLGAAGGLIMLVPGALFLAAGLGFFLRSAWALPLALLLGLTALVLGSVGAANNVFEVLGRESIKPGALWIALNELVLVIVLWLLHLVLVLSDTTTRWFAQRDA